MVKSKPIEHGATRDGLAEQPTILVADDEELMRQLIASLLTRAGFAVEVFKEGAELLLRAARCKPTLIVLDMIMPIKDGYSTLRALKADPLLSSVPILVLSAKNQEDVIARCFKEGANDYVVKPFSPLELVARVQKLIPRATL